MTKIVIKQLVWDERNRKHIKKHNVTEEEVIKAGLSLIYHKRSYQERYLAIGRSGKRLITLVLRREKEGSYYLVTARDASRKERIKVYEHEQKK